MNALMLHYFHGGEHKKSQGSISGDDLAELIEKRGVKNLLSVDEWTSKLVNNSLGEDEYCLTFDDNLKCQADIALPVLDHFGKTAFWFVYTSPYTGSIDRLELYRYFRNEFYESMDEFYAGFFNYAKQSEYSTLIEKGLDDFPEEYLKVHTFYSRGDRVFRFVRDKVLGSEKYFSLMDSMIRSKNVDLSTISKTLWLDEKTIAQLSKLGHCVGLHSHTHPTNMAGLAKEDQLNEYKKNKQLLENITQKKIEWMAHPCGSYNSITFDVLSELGIKYGFRADPNLRKYSNLELPRVDHADLIKS